jgi:hypothetical protein
VQELGETAFEAGRGDDGLHLAADARDLVEADLVHLLGRHVERGVVAHQYAVVLAPARHPGDADAVTRRGHVLVAEERQQLAIGGQRALLDGHERRSAEAGLVGCRHLRRQRPQRRKQRAVLAFRRGQLRDLLRHAGQDVVRLDHAGLEAAPQPRGRLREIVRQGLDARDPGLRLGDGSKPGIQAERRRQREETAVVGERYALRLERRELHRETQQVIEHRVADPAAVIEGVHVDGLQARQEFHTRLAARGDRIERGVRPAGGGGEVAAAPGLDRVVRDVEGLEVRDQPIELGTGIDLDAGIDPDAGIGLRRRGGATREQGHGEQCYKSHE